MTTKGNKGYGKMIANAVLAAVDDPSYVPLKARTWMDEWIEPGPRRDRERRWLSMWLEAALTDIPKADAVRYLTDMARDLESLGVEPAVRALIDKVLPRIISNGCPDD